MYETAALYLSYNSQDLQPANPTTDNSPKILELLARLGNPQLIHIENNTRIDPIPLNYPGEYTLIQGENEFWEFSGWQKGISYLESQGIEPDCILFANDMLSSGNRSMFDSLDLSAIEFCVRNNAVVGERVAFNFECEVLGKRIIPYIRTHLFVAPGSLFSLIDSIVSLNRNDAETIFSPTYSDISQLFIASDVVSDPLKKFTVDYLQNYWHRRANFSPSDPAYRSKALAILNMICLTRRIYDLDFFPLVDIQELSNLANGFLPLTFLRQKWCDESTAKLVELSAILDSLHL